MGGVDVRVGFPPQPRRCSRRHVQAFRRPVAAGGVVFRQGDVGDRYYVVESDDVEVLGDGRVVATLGPGEGFGEIALLRRTPRTATVVAHSDVRLRTLLSERFLPVVLGFTPAARVAALGVEERLHRFDPEQPPIDPPVRP